MAVKGKVKAMKTAKKPATKKIVAKKPVAKKRVAKKIVAKKIVAKKIVAKKPVAKKRVAKKIVAKKPVAKKRVAKKIVAKKKLVTKKSATKKIVAKKKPVTKKSATKKRVAKKPAAKKEPVFGPTQMPPETKVYMSASQRNWFRAKLESNLANIQDEVVKTSEDMRKKEKGLADELDRANNEFSVVVELKETDRIFKLQEKINHALRMIDSGEYGMCDDCGIEIGIKRMAARPVATKCIDCKNFQEELESNG